MGAFPPPARGLRSRRVALPPAATALSALRLATTAADRVLYEAHGRVTARGSEVRGSRGWAAQSGDGAQRIPSSSL
jgi:hypothetical protein